MRSETLAILLATLVAAFVSSSAEDVQPPGVKLDKNLRRALLKALTDLDTESEERKSLGETSPLPTTSSESTTNAEETESPEPVRTIFSFDGFPSDEESPSEDKLQNATYVESDKYLAADTSISNVATTIETTSVDNDTVFEAHAVVLPEKTSVTYEKSQEIVGDQSETQSAKSSSISSANVIDVSSKPSSNFAAESLAMSSSNGIATASALAAPSPTVSSPTARQSENSTKSSVPKKEEQEINIFQAPLVAAFTVQQDERGVPKSVVPIYSPNGNGQALTLQEQLDFKQQLLERQLAELQAQQIQQTQFLMRQQQLYEQQVRQKQHQQLFIQEQRRLKQIQEEASRLKQLEEQRNYQLQQQQQQKQVQQFSIGQQNALFSLQSPFKNPSVNVQPSFALELPKSSQAPAFQSNFHDQLRIQQLQRQQQQQAQLQQQQQQLQEARQQQLLQQQRLQQSLVGFPIDFQPPSASPAQRFNRQEAFGAVGNFGFNDNGPQRQQHQQQSANNRNHFGFNQHQSRGAQIFSYNPYQTQQLQQQQYRPQRPQTPAKQIQNLLFQSGVAGDLGTPQGTSGQEDLNIVSKVLALNVGAVPTKNFRYTANNFGNSANSA